MFTHRLSISSVSHLMWYSIVLRQDDRQPYRSLRKRLPHFFARMSSPPLSYFGVITDDKPWVRLFPSLRRLTFSHLFFFPEFTLHSWGAPICFFFRLVLLGVSFLQADFSEEPPFPRPFFSCTLPFSAPMPASPSTFFSGPAVRSCFSWSLERISPFHIFPRASSRWMTFSWKLRVRLFFHLLADCRRFPTRGFFSFFFFF